MSFFTTQVTGSIWSRASDTVPASSTKVILSTPATFKSIVVYANGFTATESKVAHHVVNLEASGVKWNSTSIVNSGLSYSVSFAVTSGNLEMSLTNNEIFELSTDVVRLELGFI